MGLYKYMVTVCTYSRPLSGEEHVLSSTVFKALKHCITEHHILGAVVQDGETEEPKLAKASFVDLSKHLLILGAINDHDKAISSFLEAVHNLPLDPDHPQWRVYVLPLNSATEQRFHIAYVCSHAFIDGRSSFSFHQTFLRALRDVDNLDYTSDPIFEVPADYHVAPALEEAGNFTISQELLKATLAAGGMVDNGANKNLWLGASSRPKRHPAAKFPRQAMEHTTVAQATIRNAVAACRSHGARLTGLLNHLAARAIVKNLQMRGYDYSKLIVCTPFDLRPLLNHDVSTMGNLSSAVNETIEVKVDPINTDHTFTSEEWDGVRSTTTLLRERSMALVDQPVRLLGYCTSFRNYLTRLASTPAAESITMSNLGTLDGRTDESDSSTWSIDHVVFSQSSHGAGSALNFNIASMKDGAMTVTVTWVPGMLGIDIKDERQFVRDVCSHMTEGLESVAQ